MEIPIKVLMITPEINPKTKLFFFIIFII
jgi:hypothetical protein